MAIVALKSRGTTADPKEPDHKLEISSPKEFAIAPFMPANLALSVSTIR